MRKRQPKVIYEAIDEFIGECPSIDSETLTAFVMQIAEKPEYDALFAEYCNKIGNNRMRRKRDDDGLRSYFSTGSGQKPKYVNIIQTETQDLPDVQAARHYQQEQMKQLRRNIAKMYRQEQILEGQIKLSDDRTGTDS